MRASEARGKGFKMPRPNPEFRALVDEVLAARKARAARELEVRRTAKEAWERHNLCEVVESTVTELGLPVYSLADVEVSLRVVLPMGTGRNSMNGNTGDGITSIDQITREAVANTLYSQIRDVVRKIQSSSDSASLPDGFEFSFQIRDHAV